MAIPLIYALDSGEQEFEPDMTVRLTAGPRERHRLVRLCMSPETYASVEWLSLEVHHKDFEGSPFSLSAPKPVPDEKGWPQFVLDSPLTVEEGMNVAVVVRVIRPLSRILITAKGLEAEPLQSIVV